MVVTNTQMWNWLWKWILNRSWRSFEAYDRKMSTYLVTIISRKWALKVLLIKSQTKMRIMLMDSGEKVIFVKK